MRTISAFFAIVIASLKPLLSIVLIFNCVTKPVFPIVKSAPFEYEIEFPLYLLIPSKTEIAESSSAANLQFPSGLVLSEANAPIMAMCCPSFFKGRRFPSFLRSTIDFFAISKAASFISLLPVISSSLLRSQYL